LQNDVSPTALSSAEQRPHHVKYALIDPSFKKTSALPKTHAQQCMECDQPHELITISNWFQTLLEPFSLGLIPLPFSLIMPLH
jgi:hypothetical protein